MFKSNKLLIFFLVTLQSTERLIIIYIVKKLIVEKCTNMKTINQ